MAAYQFALRQLERLTRSINRFVTPKVGDAATEELYTRIYLEHIHRATRPGAALSMLDAGCGAGRLSIPLARAGHRVLGIDYHESSLASAADAARSAGVTIELRRGELLESLRRLDDSVFDAALCMEVLYTCVDRDRILAELCRVVRPGGLLLASFASPAYLMGALLRQGRLGDALRVKRQRDGMLRLAKIPAYYNWTTRDEVRALYKVLDLDLLGIHPIGVWTGHGSDAMAAIVDLGQIRSAEDLESLYEIETSIPDDQLGMARYHLAIGQKPVVVAGT
jgi:ubiquinone/menaquinone biosynthesis C-methylase UbiE